MLHFAYGSNMNRMMMGWRCPGARFEGLAVLAGYRFIIMRHGLGTIVPTRGGVVHGVLWRLTTRDLAALHAYENVDTGLYRVETKVVMMDRRRVSALVYVAASRVQGRPKSGYMGVVTTAAREAGLPPHYVRGLARIAPAPQGRFAPAAPPRAKVTVHGK
jgi:cation transport regulator ChaC